VAHIFPAGFPKASIEAAIARGQGLSTSGAALESVTLEAILPPSIALVIDIETDNRKRSLADLRVVIKNHKGTVTPTSYLFTRRGRVLFEKDERRLGVDEVLDEAIEAGAEDVEADDDGNIVVWTAPSGVTAAAERLGKGLDLKVKSLHLIWHPNEDTLAPLDSKETVENLAALVDALRDEPTVQGVYTNVIQGTIDDDAWSELEEKISADA
jgi:transcriptional/translational regulatory protein YebC/TACO1